MRSFAVFLSRLGARVFIVMIPHTVLRHPRLDRAAMVVIAMIALLAARSAAGRTQRRA